MAFIFLGVFVIAAMFGFVLLFGAPYLPTTRAQRSAALDLLALHPGQRVLELGAGDGAFVIDALARGLRVTAIELNPILCVVIWLRTFRYRKSVTIRCGSFWSVNWGDYDGIYVFLLDKYMKKLDNKIIQQHKKTKLATFAFQVPGKKPTHYKEGVYLYTY